jgi:hypothetical protein
VGAAGMGEAGRTGRNNIQNQQTEVGGGNSRLEQQIRVAGKISRLELQAAACRSRR